MFLQVATIILCIINLSINIFLLCYNKKYKIGQKVYFYIGSELMVGVVKSNNILEVVDDYGEVHTLQAKQIIKEKRKWK